MIQFGYIFPLALDHTGYVQRNHNDNSCQKGLLHYCKDQWLHSQVSHQKHKNVVHNDEHEQHVCDVQDEHELHNLDDSGHGCNDGYMMGDHNVHSDSDGLGHYYRGNGDLDSRDDHGNRDGRRGYRLVARIDVGNNCGIHRNSV